LDYERVLFDTLRLFPSLKTFPFLSTIINLLLHILCLSLLHDGRSEVYPPTFLCGLFDNSVYHISLLLKMSPFKSSFKFPWATKEAAQSNGAKDQTSSDNVSNGTSRGEPERTRSSVYPEGDLRIYSKEDMEGMRGNMMLEQLYNEQKRRLWYTWGPNQGVVLKQGRGKYVACPPELHAESGGLFDQIAMMNTRVCSVLLI
jgi:hypothetical protein